MVSKFKQKFQSAKGKASANIKSKYAGYKKKSLEQKTYRIKMETKLSNVQKKAFEKEKFKMAKARGVAKARKGSFGQQLATKLTSRPARRKAMVQYARPVRRTARPTRYVSRPQQRRMIRSDEDKLDRAGWDVAEYLI